MRLIDADALAEKKFQERECNGLGEGPAYRQGWNDAIDAVMDNEPSAQPEQDIEHCATCVHDEDSVEICVLRNCKYAIAELINCYEPKQSERKKEDEHAGKKG